MKWLSCAVLLLASAASADVVDVSIRPGVPGKAPPAVLVKVLGPIRGLHLLLSRDGGEGVDVRDTPRVGQVRAIPLPHADGRFHWEGTLEVTDRSGATDALPLSFDTELFGPLQLLLDKDHDVDLAGRRLQFRTSRPVERAELELYTESGGRAWKGEFPLSAKPAGALLEAGWEAVEGELLKLALTVYDASGAYASLELFPYNVHVPHEEVVFDSGKADIRADQLPHLAAPLAELRTRLERARRWADVQLYVVGHTDRVGDPASNRALSLARARAIGQYFRRQGLSVPIFVEGFGEELPRKATADEVPEEQNRRADYILSVGEPGFTGLPFRPAWKRL